MHQSHATYRLNGPLLILHKERGHKPRKAGSLQELGKIGNRLSPRASRRNIVLPISYF